MTIEEYKSLFTEDDTVGWTAIDDVFEKIYPSQEPMHYAPPLHYAVGGEDPIDGTSIYKSTQQEEHFHLVSYGFSELYYNEKAAGGEFSKWGFELTMRVKPFAGDEGNPTWVINMMNNLARYVFSSSRWFEEYQYIPANGPIRLDTDTDITGLAFVRDPEAGRIDTPHGELTFLQIVGLTTAELERIKAANTKAAVEEVLNEIAKTNPLYITDLERRSK
ncbi:suppressor of fused domain protein [Chitinophaga sancti]|uniref:suppressor of fused domain protein n=1 Tax=Chitinophaga sancti TaxID=1004 RepID=UPI003F7A34F4